MDGVLSIGEHGSYAYNEKGQHMYPRRFFFEQICGVFSTSGRSVPVFSDKYLSYNWRDSKWMYDRAKEVGAEFIGSGEVASLKAVSQRSISNLRCSSVIFQYFLGIT